jgi:hypothetical protein
MMIRYSRQPAEGTRPGTGAKPRTAGHRARIPAATEAALWALSNGRCYAPGCTSPVVVEVRPGVYRKHPQIAHIRGVRAPRHDPSLTPGSAPRSGTC